MDEPAHEPTDEQSQRTASTPAPESGDVAAPAVNGDSERNAGLRELALRLLRWSSGDAPHDLQLLPNALPPHLPFELPLPPGARVVGALTGGRGTRVVLDTDLPPERVGDYYRERLRAAGWIEPESPPGRSRGGFVDTTHPTPERTMMPFAKETWALFVEMSGGGSGTSVGDAGGADARPTDVQLVLRSDAPPWYQYPRGPRRAQHPPFTPEELVPPLAPPAGALQRVTGGGGSAADWTSAARLETTLDVAAIAAHYTQQLERAGWTRQGGEVCGATVWSSWDFADQDGEPWRGLLVVLRWPEASGAYRLELHVMWASAEPGPYLSI